MRRPRALLLVLSLLLAACGGNDVAESGASTPSGDGAGAVTIQHRGGTTTLQEPPERIVSLDLQWTDVLVALDAPLVGAALSPYVEGGLYGWQELPDDVERITMTDGIPYERVAALEPDLIVITYGAEDETTVRRLSEIAPTIWLLGAQQVDAWEDITTTAGRILGKEEAATALVEEVRGRYARFRDELSGLAGKEYVLANYVPGDAIHVVADPDDGSSRLFAELGLRIDQDILDLAGGAAGRVQLSLEQIGLLDADLLIILTNGADTAAVPGYDLLPAVRSGAVSVLSYADVVGLNTPTPLSVPYVLDLIRPALEAAAR